MAELSQRDQPEAESDERPPQVSDPEEYNQQERLRAINQARQRVEDAIEQSMVRLVTDPDFEDADRQQVIRATLYSYLTNIEWLMAEADETTLLHEFELGQVRIEPPERFVGWVSERHTGPRVIGSPDLDAREYPIVGIQGYLTAPEVFEATWSVRVDQKHTNPQSISERKETYMPVHVSLNAFRAANRFLKDVGADIDMTPDPGDYGFDYSDILEEGPGGEAPDHLIDGGEVDDE